MYTPPPTPPNEAARLAALHNYGLLDTPPEPDLDDLARVASQICGTPISLVTLVDGDRQWFKSSIGLGVPETSRDVSFCGHTILSNEIFVVPDATSDARFAGNPLVTGNPNIRFYAGAPLLTNEGHALGSLCVIDTEPREMSPDQLDALRALGRQVVNYFELRRMGQQLQQALQAKSEFLRIASHDLKNPLSVVLNAATMLSESMAPGKPLILPDGVPARLSTTIERQARQMTSLINDYLDAQAIEDNQVVLNLAPHSLLELAKHVCNDLATYAESKNSTLSIDAEGDPIIECDASRITQVLTNLVGNAIKFSPIGSEVKVHIREAVELPANLCVSAAKAVSAVQNAAQQNILLTVRDQGPGILATEECMLFTRYGKLSARPTGKEKSSGLGLHIARQLIEAHGGTIGVYNNPDRGATFWFALPGSTPA